MDSRLTKCGVTGLNSFQLAPVGRPTALISSSARRHIEQRTWPV